MNGVHERLAVQENSIQQMAGSPLVLMPEAQESGSTRVSDVCNRRVKGLCDLRPIIQ